MNIDSAMTLLADIITDSEHNNRDQGIEFYQSAMCVLISENVKKSELKSLHSNFCGYLAYGEFDNAEYQKILKLIDFLE
ncbi:hypothetical protein C5E22_22320 [Pectobacterium parmentieri]|uniref:hypothetical protein n=1 Tax=Pectobacterium parmentieri TaxID=1905730 RepID=UPI000EAB57BB|nr:hypothetical protein [Pectobacterium parmentieri]AYH07755.1 hypothetical protein C5E25_21665 [Pectobacterium parmentieri]AYH20949.1 hypothetical protein C5E22_22320 [Pectobacterium parmentieri]AYH25209.1 hypothetical protein C5E21_21290 [Pectobacterium parmentieri]MBN3177342.1 hypothetical protein [Pectobacterium parmentieri]QRN29842.1 hypothetical protein IG623_21775 [Pectobacterium parmentieri]